MPSPSSGSRSSPAPRLVGVLASALRHHVLGRPRVATWLRRGFAATYVVLAARLATSER
jgi:threonine/homoserine/homoserine lactone efflux protein